LTISTQEQGKSFVKNSDSLCLLFEQFGDQAVVISAILPDHIRQFVATQSKLCKVSTSIGASISALRCYFRIVPLWAIEYTS
jgi:hypothetical protein